MDNNSEIPFDQEGKAGYSNEWKAGTFRILCQDRSPEQAKLDVGNEKAKKGDIVFSYLSGLAKTGREQLFFYEEGSAPAEGDSAASE